MFTQRLLIFIVAIALLGCEKKPHGIISTSKYQSRKKELAAIDCLQLQAAMAVNDIEAVKILITQSIENLGYPDYSLQNLNELTSLLGKCLSAEVVCFDCIKILPSLSEIKLSFVVSGLPVQKVIDISSSIDNKMTFYGMHNWTDVGNIGHAVVVK